MNIKEMFNRCSRLTPILGKVCQWALSWIFLTTTSVCFPGESLFAPCKWQLQKGMPDYVVT
jgi:hypothetical protein